MEYRENRDVRRPFLATPDARVYFPAAAIERARRTTERCLRRGEGIALVVGATGVGKTILSRVLAASFEADDLTVVATPTRKSNVKSFLQQILFGLRQTYCGCDETELRLMTLDYLARSASRRFVLIVDDAQNLSLPIFDEIRVLVDQGSATSAQISVALIGTNRLEERLNLPRLYPIQQRIAVRSYLETFERAETNDYLDGEMRRVGWPIRFSNDAKKMIAELSDGSPRIVNQLSDRALLTALGDYWTTEGEETNANVGVGNEFLIGRFSGSEEIGREFVERAWANLLNLPEEEANGDAASGTNGCELESVVEFGTLDDETDGENNVFDDSHEFSDLNALNGSWEETAAILFTSSNDDVEAENLKNNDEESARFPDESLLNDANQDEYNEQIDWEAERYGRFEAARSEFGGDAKAKNDDEFAENERTTDEKNEFNDAAEIEIDAELEARLLAKFGDSDVKTSNEREDNAEFSDISDKLDDDGGFANLTEAAALGFLDEPKNGDFESSEAQNFERDDERNPQRSVFNALKSNDFGEATEIAERFDGATETNERSRECCDNNENADFSAAVDEFSRLYPKSKTRRALGSDDDGSREFERVNGFSVEESPCAEERERFWEANLSANCVSGKAVYSGRDQEGNCDCNWNYETNCDEFLSLEDRAYRQIVDIFQKTIDDFAVGECCLTELSLLEQEIENGADLVRRIYDMRMSRRDNFDDDAFDSNGADKSDFLSDSAT